jgi:hypothetical protein
VNSSQAEEEGQELGWRRGGRHGRGRERDHGLAQDSWVDAVVTLLATIIFGLGWVLVELERAEPPVNRYDAAVSTAWVAAVATSINARTNEVRPTEMVSVRPIATREDGDAGWTEQALQMSNR